jgi:hypothetical protein
VSRNSAIYLRECEENGKKMSISLNEELIQSDVNGYTDLQNYRNLSLAGFKELIVEDDEKA